MYVAKKYSGKDRAIIFENRSYRYIWGTFISSKFHENRKYVTAFLQNNFSITYIVCAKYLFKEIGKLFP